VADFDHHCIWLGTCIGARNYNRFIKFLTVLMVWIVNVVSSSLSKKGWVIGGVASVMGVLILYLYSYHLKLIFLNQTTHEVIKNKTNYYTYATFIENIKIRLRFNRTYPFPSYIHVLLAQNQSKNQVSEGRIKMKEGYECMSRVSGLDFFRKVPNP
jgi:hypothetical protein